MVNTFETSLSNTAHVLSVMIALVSVAGTAFGAGQALGVKHPVFDYKIDKDNAAGYEKGVERVMAMSEEEVLSFVPPYAIVYYCECPNCYGGVEGNNIFIWSIDRPDELKCRFCDEIVYPNDKYPENQLIKGKNKLGEEISFPYYLNEDKDIPHFFSTHLLRHKRGWLVGQLIALGRAYQATAKAEYAARVVLVLDKFGQVYPHYPVMQNGCRRFKFRESQEMPYPWDSGKWGYFHNEIPKPLLTAYDLVCESKEFDKLSEERGYDVRERLENDFFKATYEVIAASPYHVSNVVGYDIAGAAILGRIINEPAYVHRAFGWMKQNVDEGFFYDGMWHEAPSYHYMTIGGIRAAFDTVRGHTDPPGYVDEIDGTRFDDFDPDTQVPFWARCVSAPAIVSFPNGCVSPIHDSWAGSKYGAPARAKTVSTILPGYGHASLGRGTGGDQMQAQLHFSGGYGHTHLDNLNLILWAKGREMLPDLGYTWTQMRYWCACTLGHNTVVIDRQDQKGSGSDGDLLWFFPDSNGVSVVDADGKRGYKQIEGLDMYRRMLVMIPVSDADAYVVDVFRVRGGSMHEWALHGDADEDTTATCSLDLSGSRKWMLEEGEEWKEPTIEGARFNPYGMIRDVANAETEGDFQVDFNYVEETTRGVRIHMLNDQSAEVWLGRAPSVRRMGVGTRGDMRKAYDFWMPQLLVRRQAEAPLASVFAAVEEPYSGKPFIRRVERVQLTPADDNAIALRVTHGDTVDTIISTLDEPPYPQRVTADGVAFNGKLGILREVNGKTTGAWLFEGEKLTGGGWMVASEKGRYDGQIQAATRKADGAEYDAFVTDAELPADDVLHGVWMIVTHGNGFTHGYEIDRVEVRDGKTFVLLTDDHGLKIDGSVTEEVFFPQREIEGTNSFVIPLAVAMVKGQ